MSKIIGRTESEIAPIPTWIDVRVIAANGTDTATVPSGVRSVFMTTTSPVWMCLKNGSVVADIPSGDLSDGKGALYFSGTALFQVGYGDVITFKAPVAAGCTVSLGWYGKAAP